MIDGAPAAAAAHKSAADQAARNYGRLAELQSDERNRMDPRRIRRRREGRRDTDCSAFTPRPATCWWYR